MEHLYQMITLNSHQMITLNSHPSLPARDKNAIRTKKKEFLTRWSKHGAQESTPQPNSARLETNPARGFSFDQFPVDTVILSTPSLPTREKSAIRTGENEFFSFFPRFFFKFFSPENGITLLLKKCKPETRIQQITCSTLFVMGAVPLHTHTYTHIHKQCINWICSCMCSCFFDGYCATAQGSLDWFEVDLSARPASSFRVLLAAMCCSVLQWVAVSCFAVCCSITCSNRNVDGLTKPHFPYGRSSVL